MLQYVVEVPSQRGRGSESALSLSCAPTLTSQLQSTRMQSITVDSYHPFPAIHFTLPSTTPLSLLSYILSPLCPPALQSISTHSNQHIPLHSTLPLSTLSTTTTNDQHVHLRLAVKLLGGKGGFASQLRAQGGRMSSNKATNNDSCRDLNGRRLSTINEATKCALGRPLPCLAPLTPHPSCSRTPQTSSLPPSSPQSRRRRNQKGPRTSRRSQPRNRSPGRGDQ